MRNFKLFLVLCFFLYFCLPSLAQNKCDELQREHKQLSQRLKEIDAELAKCNTSPSPECEERSGNGNDIEVKSMCAEVKGNTLIVHFAVRNTISDNPKQTIYLYADTNNAFDQKGKKYTSNRIHFYEKDFSIGYMNFDLVYNIWYEGTLEFPIGANYVNQIRLLEIDGNGAVVSLEQIEVSQK